MEYIMNAICSFIERNLTVGRIITKFIPVGLSAQALSPAIIFLLTLFLIKFMPKKFGFAYGNKNNNSCGGIILKSPTYATVLRAIHIFCCIYMVLWNVYLLIRPISNCEIDDILRNVVWIVVMLVAVFMMSLCILSACSLIPMFFDENKVIKIYIFSGIAIVVCMMFSEEYFESSYITFWTVASIWLFSGLTAIKCGNVNYISYDTKRYFREKDKKETYVTKKADNAVLSEIVNSMPAIGSFNGERIESLKSFEQIFGRNLFPVVPVVRCDNDEYFAMFRELGGYNAAISNVNNDWNEKLSNYSAAILDAANCHNYSVSMYKKEAIGKVFEALGYGGEQTCENYINFRKTASLLEKMYHSKIDEQRYLWKTKYEDDIKIISSGILGEKRVVDALNELEKHYCNMRVLYNFRFGYASNSTAECDALVLTTGGIFCIEVKNYGEHKDYTLEISPNGTWYKKYGEQLHQIDSDPFRQNKMHAEALVQRFGEEFRKLTPDGTIPQIHELVVVPNDISINNQSQNRVLHIGGLKEYIVNEASKYDMDTVNVIAKTLLQANMDPMKTERIDYLLWKQQIDAAECLEEEFSRISNEIKLSEKYRII